MYCALPLSLDYCMQSYTLPKCYSLPLLIPHLYSSSTYIFVTTSQYPVFCVQIFGIQPPTPDLQSLTDTFSATLLSTLQRIVQYPNQQHPLTCHQKPPYKFQSSVNSPSPATSPASPHQKSKPLKGRCPDECGSPSG